MKKTGKYIVPICVILAGVFFAVYSYTHYQILSPAQGPMQGFMPMVLGVLLAVSGFASLIQAKNEEDKALDLRNWSIVAAMALVVIFNFIIGTLPSIMIFLLFWLKCVSKYSWKMTLIIFAILMIFVIGVFKIWMDIPFTEGLLMEMIFG